MGEPKVDYEASWYKANKTIVELEKQLAEAKEAAVSGYWACSKCDNIEFHEREVLCWKCGEGEMLYQDKEALSSFVKQATAAFKKLRELREALEDIKTTCLTHGVVKPNLQWRIHEKARAALEGE